LFLLSVDLSIDPNYGFVKAVRKVRSCNAKKVASDSLSLFIHADFEGDAESALECLREIAGLATIDVKLCLRLPTDAKSLREVLRSLGYSIIPQPLSTRYVAYKQLSSTLRVFIERTSREGIYLARVCRGTAISIPPPYSAFAISGVIDKAVDEALKIVEILKNIFNEFLSRGVDASC